MYLIKSYIHQNNYCKIVIIARLLKEQNNYVY